MIFNLPKDKVVLEKTLQAGETSVAFEGISENAMIDIYTDNENISYTGKSYADGVLTVNFDAQEVVVKVRVRCS